MARNNFEGVENPKTTLEYSKVSSEAERQFSTTSDGDPSGGNLSGHNPKPWNPMFVPDFQGKSGQPDNQSTNRPKGST